MTTEQEIKLLHAARSVINEYRIMRETNNMAYHELPLAIGKLSTMLDELGASGRRICQLERRQKQGE